MILPGRILQPAPFGVRLRNASILCLVSLLPCLLTSCSGSPPVEIADAAATTFLDQLREGHVDDAWSSTTAEFKSAEGRESFRRVVKNETILKKPMKQSSSEAVTVNNLAMRKVKFQTADGSSSKAIELLLAVENDVWKVEHFAVK